MKECSIFLMIMCIVLIIVNFALADNIEKLQQEVSELTQYRIQLTNQCINLQHDVQFHKALAKDARREMLRAFSPEED